MTITRSASPLRATLFLAALCACSATTSSPSGPGSGQGVAVAVVPRTVSLYTAQSLAFSSAVTGSANTAVTWSVQEGSTGGTVTAAGVYTAPGSVGTYHVVAASQADPSVSASAVVMVMAQPPVTGGTWPAVGYSAACRDEPLRATGTVYYFCDCSGPGADPACAGGDDSRTDSQARSPSTPWKSFSKAADKFSGASGLAAIAAGDTIALCGGGGFTTAGSSWHNANCAASNTCDVRDYLPPGYAGADQKPVITYTGSGGKAFDLSYPGHEEGYRFMNLDLRAALYKTSNSGLGFNFNNDVSNVLVCNLNISGFRFAWMGDGGSTPVGHHIEVRGSTIRDSQQDATLFGCDDCGISDSLFDGNGCSNGADHVLYLNNEMYGGVSHPAQRMFVTNNIIHPGTDGSGQCAGALIVAHSQHVGTVIDHNIFDTSAQNPQGTCYGVMFNAGGSTIPAGFSGISIRRNTFTGFQSANQVSLSTCADCVVESNLFKSSSNAIFLGEQAKRSQDLWTNDRITVRNNTVYLAGGWVGYAITFDGEGTGHVVANNLVYAEGSGGFRGIAATGGLGASAFAYWDHNDVYGRAPWALVGGTTYATAADLKAATGLDAWAAGAASLAPLLVGVPSDFRPQAGSPLVGAADPAQAPATDLTGAARHVPPDIGAFEH